MPLSGDTETVYLFSILQLLCNDKKTGVLRVWKGVEDVKIYLNEGTIIYATGSQKKFRLGYLLRTSGIVSAQNIRKCLKIANQKGQALGKVMVEEGFVTNKKLTDFMHEKVQETLYDLFMWKKGNFEFSQSNFNLSGHVITELNTMELILEASRRVDEQAAKEESGSAEDLLDSLYDDESIEFTSIGVPNISPSDDDK
jgi:Domain of unknown function (DUF4388)